MRIASLDTGIAHLEGQIRSAVQELRPFLRGLHGSQRATSWIPYHRAVAVEPQRQTALR